ncbi:MAG: FMN-binding protein [Spirochaetaceae bacterium]|jgi:fumarate reductase flavoprotein subunit|nr:FMN-binding protein [Spirochaetaceae bacterium]
MTKMVFLFLLVTVLAVISACVTQPATVSYTPGTYEGIGQGFHGEIKVSVTVNNRKIVSVTVTENNETAGVGSRAVDRIPESIVHSNSVEVDDVSGATVSSRAIKVAVTQALDMAKD